MQNNQGIIGASTHLGDMGLIVVSYIALSILDIIVLGCIGLIMNSVVEGRSIVNFILLGFDVEISLINLGIFCLSVSSLKLFVGYAANYTIFSYSEKRQKQLKDSILNLYLNNADLYQSNIKKGQFISAISQFAASYVQKKVLATIRLAADAFIAGMLVLYLSINYGLNLIIFGFFVVIGLWIIIIFLKRPFEYLGSNINAITKDVIENSEAIFDIVDEARAHNITQNFSNRFYRLTDRAKNLATRFNTLTAMPKFAFETIIVILVVTFLIFTSMEGQADFRAEEIGSFAASIIFLLIRSLPFMTNAIAWKMNFEVGIKAEDQLLEAISLLKIDSHNIGRENNNTKNQIVLSNISFGSFGSTRPFSRNFLLEKKYRIVGPSGCGKSSLLKLIAGSVSPDIGRITFPGYGRPSLKVAYAAQKPIFFPGTLRENLELFGCPISERTFLQLVEDLDLKAWMKRNNIGLDQHINPSNFAGSGGEFQRLALLRLLASDADIYLLDEVTSALDSELELSILHTIFNKYLLKKTVFIISHGDIPPYLYDEAVDLLKVEHREMSS